MLDESETLDDIVVPVRLLEIYEKTNHPKEYPDAKYLVNVSLPRFLN